MTVDEYRKEMLENVSAQAAAGEEFRHSSFVEYGLELLADAGEVSDAQTCYYRGTGSRNRNSGVDAYATDEADDSLRLFIADFRGGPEPGSLTLTDSNAWFARLQTFCEDSFSGKAAREMEESAAAHGLAATLNQLRPKITRLRFYLLTDAEISSRIRDLPEISVDGLIAECHIWDVGRFLRVFESRTGMDDLDVDFSEALPGGLQCIAASVGSTQYKAYLCVIPAGILASVYEKYGSRLLEGNVRSFLTARGKVNKGIRNTILNRPEMFFAFNNGIACTASNVELRGTTEGLRIVRAKDLQIVNGAQTTASLASAERNDHAALDSILVQMKLSVVPPEESGEIIPEISRCANSQNKVSEADFFSNHEFHRRIEEISRRLWAPAAAGAQYETHWFYERARGQYLNEQAKLTQAAKRKFLLLNPRDQLITKTDLAKFANSWRQLPHAVSQGSQKNFLAFSTYAAGEWDRAADQFNDDYFKRLVAQAILFKTTDKIVPQQPWYQHGYKANIVTYTVAKLSEALDQQCHDQTLNLRQIWARQSLPGNLRQALATVARAMFDVIVNPDSAFQNVTEWCKKEACWARAARVEIPIDLSQALGDLLIDKADEQAMQRSSKRGRRVDDGIENQAAVLALGGPYWASARAWARQGGLSSPDDDGILAVAASIPQKLPTEKQSWRLLQIKARLEAEGLPNPGQPRS